MDNNDIVQEQINKLKKTRDEAFENARIALEAAEKPPTHTKVFCKKYNEHGELEDLVAVNREDIDESYKKGLEENKNLIDISSKFKEKFGDKIKEPKTPTLKQKVINKWDYLKWRITHLGHYSCAYDFKKRAGIK